MKATIIINNYNYAKFITKSIDSVIRQTYKNIEIIIVDDGSTDESLKLLNNNYRRNHFVTIVAKKNGGQLSTFNEALKYITGDIIFFLDSDDMYKSNYIEKILRIYKNDSSIDFVFCAMEKLFNDGRKEIVRKYKENTDIGFSRFSAIYTKEWVGGETSSLSMKKDILNKILPIPFEKNWRTRADDCLVWGSSIVGAKKYYNNDPLVIYRIHGMNAYYGKTISYNYLTKRHKRQISVNRLLLFFMNKLDLNDRTLNLILLEFNSRNPKKFVLLIRYMIIILSSKEVILLKIKKTLSLIFIYCNK